MIVEGAKCRALPAAIGDLELRPKKLKHKADCQNLQGKAGCHFILQGLPQESIGDMQSFTLFYTAAPRVQFALRTLAPRLTCEFAVAHDAVVLDTLRPLLCAEESEKLSSLPPAASRVAQLALRHGGLGLLKAALHAPAAFWTFWADSCVVRSGCTLLARSGATSLQAFRFIPIRDLLEATDVLVAAGFRTSLWADRCRCQDVLGDHVSACPRLRCGLERAATCLPRGRSNCGYAATRPLCRR